MDKQNGGPAFPTEFNSMDYNQGMTLRDWFAGQALAGLLAQTNSAGSAAEFSRQAFVVADAMLKAR